MPLMIGLIFETFDTYPRRAGDPDDFAAEFEPESTLVAIESAFARLGHQTRRVGSPLDLLKAIAEDRIGDLDAAFSIAEGHGPRTREGWTPSLLEMAQIPMFGSDALTLSLSLDKRWTRRAVASAGIRVAPQCEMTSEQQARHGELPAPFPLFVKPRWEGSSKGIRASSRVENRAALACEVLRINRDYDQPALVEAFVDGAEYTVSVVGNSPPRACPVLQRALDQATKIGLHAVVGVHEALRDPTAPARDHELPGKLAPELEAQMQQAALDVYALFECRDFARLDFRLDADERPVFLELNPLPTFAVDGSFAVLAELEGRTLVELLAEVFDCGLERLGLTSGGFDGKP